MERKTNTLPFDIIERWLKDKDCDVRCAAMNACNGKDVPLEVIERGLKDEDWRVRCAAMNACVKNGIDIPLIRTFEPPEKVYKKCKFGIIVVATIPKDAQVRGKEGSKCRASKADIVEIIGSEVGFSKHNDTICYLAGDKVEIENFDYSDEECSTGFHFFCTREEAARYE